MSKNKNQYSPNDDDHDYPMINSKEKQATCLKRGKTQVTMLGLILVFHFIGWDGGASFLDQSQSEVKQNKSN